MNQSVAAFYTSELSFSKEQNSFLFLLKAAENQREYLTLSDGFVVVGGGGESQALLSLNSTHITVSTENTTAQCRT